MKPTLQKDNSVSLDGKLATIIKEVKSQNGEKRFKLRLVDDFSEIEANESQLTPDLFEHPDNVPQEVQAILKKFVNKMINGMTYNDCSTFVKKLEEVGYTCEYYLDAQPYFLRKSDIKLIE